MSLAIVAAAVCGRSAPASASSFSVLDALDGTVYAIFSNLFNDQAVITQLVASAGPGMGTSSGGPGFLMAIEGAHQLDDHFQFR